MSNGFIKNEELLKETHEVEDLLDFSRIQDKFKKELNGINKSSLVGLVGGFGMGKSVMLHQLSKSKTENEIWINFDAWKFPERKNLWEGFVLDFVRSVDEKFFEGIRKKIDGEKDKDLKSLIRVLFRGANYFMPGTGIGENFASLFDTSPARRVFEFQEILQDFINKKINKDIKNIYVIVEDI